MLLDLSYIAIGLVLLVFGGDALVRGAVNLALRLDIPALVVGLTVVAFGTSAPELLVSVQAVLNEAPGIALGNVIGSNIANVLLVMGVPAIIATIHTSQLDLRRSYLTMIAASALFIVLCFMGPLRVWHALILLAGLIAMILDSYLDGRRKKKADADEDLEGVDPSMPGWKIGAFLLAGLVALPFGADFLVTGAVSIARDYGVSETVIGLTLVAVGTSLPELATSIIAAFRKQPEVAMGNVIGSNVFNLLGIIGITGLVGDIPVPAELLTFDLWVMLGVAVLIAPFILMGRDITRTVGIAMCAAYAAYVAYLVV